MDWLKRNKEAMQTLGVIVTIVIAVVGGAYAAFTTLFPSKPKPGIGNVQAEKPVPIVTPTVMIDQSRQTGVSNISAGDGSVIVGGDVVNSEISR